MFTETRDIEELKDLPPVYKKSHPMSTPKKVQEKIIGLVPFSYGVGVQSCGRPVKHKGVSVSAPTVQKVLNNESLGSRYQRWLEIKVETAEQQSMQPYSRASGFCCEKQFTFKESRVESSHSR